MLFVSWFLCRTHDDFADETVRFLTNKHVHCLCDVFRPEHAFPRVSRCLAWRKARIGRARADHGHPNTMLPYLFRKGPDVLQRDINGVSIVGSAGNAPLSATRVLQLLNQPINGPAFGGVLP